jgi:hypothetical protein
MSSLQSDQQCTAETNRYNKNNEQDWDSGMMQGKMKSSLLRNDAGKNELI